MTELRINHVQYLFNLSRIGIPMLIFYLMLIYLPEPENTFIFLLGKFIGLPLGTYMFFWFLSRYPKAIKSYIVLERDELIINGYHIKLSDVKKAYVTEHVINPIQFWCPGIIVDTVSGNQIKYITYYGISRKDLRKFSNKLNRLLKNKDKAIN